MDLPPHTTPRTLSLWSVGFVALLLLLWSSAASAAVLYKSKDESQRLELSGYVKSFASVQFGTERFFPETIPSSFKQFDDLIRALLPNTPAQNVNTAWKSFRREFSSLGMSQSWVRFRLKMKFNEQVSLHAAYEFRPVIGSQPTTLLSSIPTVGPALFGDSGGLFGGGSGGMGSFGVPAGFDDRWLDFPMQAHSTHSFQLLHQLDRLFVSFSISDTSITVGRQPISIGVGRVFRPSDLLAPFSPYELDLEEKRGVDAAKVEIPIGEMSELMLVAVVQRRFPDKARELGANGYFDDISPGGLARLKLTLGDVDTYVMLGYLQGDLIASLGASTSLFGAGVRVEATYHYAWQWDDKRRPNGLLNVSAGIDYNIAKINLMVGLEYYYHGAGGEKTSEYLDLPEDQRYLRRWSFLLGQQYLALYGSWQIHPLLTFRFSTLFNVQDLSVLLAPTLEFAAKQDIYLVLASFVGFGAGPEVAVNNDQMNIKLKSEFGAVGASVILGIRVYF